MVPSIANWPVCKSGGVQFAGIISKGLLKPVVENVDFKAKQSMPVIEAMVAFARQQLAVTGKNLFCASWADYKLVFCLETEPMVLIGSSDLNFGDVLKNLEHRAKVDVADVVIPKPLIEWETNLDRHFWNFLQIVERTSASRTLLLGFGLENFKMGIAEGAIHEAGKLANATGIVKRFRSTARARRKITYFAGARRRKSISAQAILPMELARAFASPAPSDIAESNAISWALCKAGWPVKTPDAAAFKDYKTVRSMYGASLDLLRNTLQTDQLTFCLMNTGEEFGQLVKHTHTGLIVENGHSLTSA